MLCAKYDYKMDIAVKKAEAKEEKAEEIAIALLEKKYPPETIAECVGLSLEKVLELQESITVKA